MFTCDEFAEYIARRQSELEALAAERYSMAELDDDAIAVPIGTKKPPWGKAPPELSLAPAGGVRSVDRDNQRTVKASVC